MFRCLGARNTIHHILEKRSNLGVPLGLLLCKSSIHLFLYFIYILLRFYCRLWGRPAERLDPFGVIILKKAEPASAPPSRVAASCPLQAIQEQATLEDSPHVGQTHRRVHVLALQPLPTARARSAVRPASSQRLRGTLRRQQPSSARHVERRRREPLSCCMCSVRAQPGPSHASERSASLI